jgi:hypothetical protein
MPPRLVTIAHLKAKDDVLEEKCVSFGNVLGQILAKNTWGKFGGVLVDVGRMHEHFWRSVEMVLDKS